MLIAIFGNEFQNLHFADLQRLFDALYRLPDAVLAVESRFASYLDGHISLPGNIERFPADALPACDLVLSIGGDGTFLRTVRWAGGDNTPVVGINTGHLGYLAAYGVNETEAIAAALFDGHCVCENRTMIEIVKPARRFGSFNYALNDVAILRGDSSSMLTMRVWLDGEELATYRADGLIISTPTGSTGYNLSVGGPIVAPTARNFVISPAAAHALTMRPFVISDDITITVTTDCRTDSYLVSLDGKSAPMRAGSTIIMRRAPMTACVVRRAGHTFIDTLRTKLLWGK